MNVDLENLPPILMSACSYRLSLNVLKANGLCSSVLLEELGKSSFEFNNANLILLSV